MLVNKTKKLKAIRKKMLSSGKGLSGITLQWINISTMLSQSRITLHSREPEGF